MNPQFLAVALVSALALTEVAAKQPSVVGQWDWARKTNNCTERYVFRGDGTVSIQSGEEQVERTYLMTWAPEATGRYKVTLTTVKDSGGSGCADSVEGNTARSAVVHILFGGSGETMLICNSPEGADCIGPLKRTRP